MIVGRFRGSELHQRVSVSRKGARDERVREEADVALALGVKKGRSDGKAPFLLGVGIVAEIDVLHEYVHRKDREHRVPEEEGADK